MKQAEIRKGGEALGLRNPAPRDYRPRAFFTLRFARFIIEVFFAVFLRLIETILRLVIFFS